jgi:hypothetical protein
VTDLTAFRRVCHEAARQTGFEVAEFRISNGPTPNFHQAILAGPGRTVAVVCVRDTALLALAVPRLIEFEPTREAGPLTFVDVPELAAALAEAPEFRLLSAVELNGPVDTTRWPQISQRDLNHWQPDSLGEALFNYWD